MGVHRQIVAVPALNVRLVVTVASQLLATPARVKVPEPRLSVLVPVPVMLKLGATALANVMLGLFAEKSRVPVKAPIARPAIVFPLMVESTVTVPPPELASKVAVSEDCLGMPPVAPHVEELPPEDDDHDAVFAVDHDPVPPTQKQAAAIAGDVAANAAIAINAARSILIMRRLI